MNDQNIYQELAELVLESIVEKISNGNTSIVLINELKKIPSFYELTQKISVKTVHNQHIENNVSQIVIDLLKQKFPNNKIQSRSRWGQSLIIDFWE